MLIFVSELDLQFTLMWRSLEDFRIQSLSFRDDLIHSNELNWNESYVQ
jgi:hypothetical protein